MSNVFAPTAESLTLGSASFFAYASMLLSPRSSPSLTWLGSQFGLLSPFPYGASGLRFGGIEAGLDAILPYAYGLEQPYVQAVLNAKLTPLAEGQYSPAVGLGFYGLNVYQFRHGVRFAYVVASKTVGPWGRFTVGLGGSLADDPLVFTSTFPFRGVAPLALIAGYVSPQIGPLSFAVDYIGGDSTMSGASAAAFLTIAQSTTVMIGGFVTNNDYAGGLFVSLNVLCSLPQAFAQSVPATKPAGNTGHTLRPENEPAPAAR